MLTSTLWSHQRQYPPARGMRRKLLFVCHSNVFLTSRTRILSRGTYSAMETLVGMASGPCLSWLTRESRASVRCTKAPGYSLAPGIKALSSGFREGRTKLDPGAPPDRLPGSTLPAGPKVQISVASAPRMQMGEWDLCCTKSQEFEPNPRGVDFPGVPGPPQSPVV
jgi:hypothetical protein